MIRKIMLQATMCLSKCVKSFASHFREFLPDLLFEKVLVLILAFSFLITSFKSAIFMTKVILASLSFFPNSF